MSITPFSHFLRRLPDNVGLRLSLSVRAQGPWCIRWLWSMCLKTCRTDTHLLSYEDFPGKVGLCARLFGLTDCAAGPTQTLAVVMSALRFPR